MWPIENVSFVHPGFFWLLLPLALLVLWQLRVRQRRQVPPLRWSGLQAFEGVQTWRVRWQRILPLLRIAVLVLLVVALARPQRTLREEEVKAEGIDIVLVMDLSSSMLAQDFQPSRLEVSKQVAVDFVDKRPYDRIGLVTFSGEAFTQTPVTTDHTVVKEMLGGLQCGILEDGTAIGMGLATAVNRLKDSQVKSKVAILLTDGVNNAGYVKPVAAAEIAQQYGVKVYTIGIGTTGEALSPVGRRSDGAYVYDFVPVEIDEPLLQQIAGMTGGFYYRATTKEKLEMIYAEIDRLEKTEIDVRVRTRYGEEFRYFAAAGLCLLALELLLRYFVFTSINT